MDFPTQDRFALDNKALQDRVGIKLTWNQWLFFRNNAQDLLSGPFDLEGRIAYHLRAKGLIRGPIKNELEELHELTDWGHQVALRFGQPATPGTIAQFLRDRLDLDRHIPLTTEVLVQACRLLRSHPILLKWHAVDCIAYQGGTIRERTQVLIKETRRMLVEGDVKERVIDPKPGRRRRTVEKSWEERDGEILRVVLYQKAWLWPKRREHSYDPMYLGSARRARDYAIDRAFAHSVGQRVREEKLIHWQGMQLLHLCEIWQACGERTAGLLLEGTCPHPARWDEKVVV